jgi:hypothetical protein
MPGSNKNSIYHREPPVTEINASDDPVLAMLGVGKELWETESADEFVERLRSEDLPVLPHTPVVIDALSTLSGKVWDRVGEHQGEPFKTATGLPFTYQVEGSGLWFFRNGRRVNRKLTRTQFDVAVSRCPLIRTTEIKDLIDYPYLFALLNDSRIRGRDW